MEASQGGEARAAGILTDGEVCERGGVLLCRLGGLVYVWAAPGAAQIEMRTTDPAGELAYGPVLGYVETTRPQDGLTIAFQADEFLRHCQDVTRMAAEAPIITEPQAGPAEPGDGAEDLAEAFVEALARDEYERSRQGEPHMPPFDEVVPDERTGSSALGGYYERARAYLGALPRLAAVLRQGQGEPPADPAAEEAARAARREQIEAEARQLLATFSANLTAALEGGASFEDAISVFNQVQEQANELLSAATAAQPQPKLPDIRTARALLVDGQGWVLVKPETLRFVRPEGDQGPAMAVFEPQEGQGLPHEPGEEFVAPMPDVMAMCIPPAPTLPEVPEAQTFDSEEGHDQGQPGAEVSEPTPEPATPVEGSQEPPAPEAAPPADPAAQPAPVGDRVQTTGGRQGQVVDGPDAEGKVGVQIDGAGVERFGHDELVKLGEGS